MPVLVPAVVVTALFYPFRNKQSAVEHEYQFMSILNVKTVLLIPWSWSQYVLCLLRISRRMELELVLLEV